MRMRLGFWGVSIVVIAAAVLATAGIAVAQQSPGDTANGDDILTTVSHALPAFIAWALAFILVMRVLSVLEMGVASIVLVLATIGAILWRYHWLPVH